MNFILDITLINFKFSFIIKRHQIETLENPVEDILCNEQKAGMLAYMKANPKGIESLIQLSIIDKQPYSWRAAWLLSKCMDKNDKRIAPFVPQMIQRIKIGMHSQKRDLLTVLQKMEIPEDEEGLLFDICVDIWCRLDHIPSVRLNAFRMILKIANKIPELKEEVLLLAEEEYLDSLSGGIQTVVLRLINTLKSK